MGDAATGRTSVLQKVTGAVKETLALALYLYICIGAVVLLKSAVLRDVGVDIAIWGIAIVKALILAKFMLIGRDLKLGRRFRDRPLIWPIIYHALIFLILLLVLTTMEEILVGSSSPIAHRSILDANLRQRFGVIVVGIQRADRHIDFNPEPDASIQPGDRLVVLGRPDSLKKLEGEAS